MSVPVTEIANLKNCPFCGSNHVVPARSYSRGSLAVCNACGASAPYALWNARAEGCTCSAAASSLSIDELGLSSRASSLMRRLKIHTQGDLVCFVKLNGLDGIGSFRGVGEKTASEIYQTANAIMEAESVIDSTSADAARKLKPILDELLNWCEEYGGEAVYPRTPGC